MTPTPNVTQTPNLSPDWPVKTQEPIKRQLSSLSNGSSKSLNCLMNAGPVHQSSIIVALKYKLIPNRMNFASQIIVFAWRILEVMFLPQILKVQCTLYMHGLTLTLVLWFLLFG